MSIRTLSYSFMYTYRGVIITRLLQLSPSIMATHHFKRPFADEQLPELKKSQA